MLFRSLQPTQPQVLAANGEEEDDRRLNLPDGAGGRVVARVRRRRPARGRPHGRRRGHKSSTSRAHVAVWRCNLARWPATRRKVGWRAVPGSPDVPSPRQGGRPAAGRRIGRLGEVEASRGGGGEDRRRFRLDPLPAQASVAQLGRGGDGGGCAKGGKWREGKERIWLCGGVRGRAGLEARSPPPVRPLSRRRGKRRRQKSTHCADGQRVGLRAGRTHARLAPPVSETG